MKLPSNEYKQLLDEAWDLHIRKNAGYAGAESPDPWANFRMSEAFNVSAFEGCMVRLTDKYIRVTNLMKSADNEQVGESIRDTLRDLSAYALIAVCLLDEQTAKAEPVEEVATTFMCGHQFGEEPTESCDATVHWTRVNGVEFVTGFRQLGEPPCGAEVCDGPPHEDCR